jgi:hypothetical protein
MKSWSTSTLSAALVVALVAIWIAGPADACVDRRTFMARLLAANPDLYQEIMRGQLVPSTMPGQQGLNQIQPGINQGQPSFNQIPSGFNQPGFNQGQFLPNQGGQIPNQGNIVPNPGR